MIFRQDEFLKSLNLTWVGHFDVDEFVVMNRVGDYDVNFFQQNAKYNTGEIGKVP